jgi:hypothetical protein
MGQGRVGIQNPTRIATRLAVNFHESSHFFAPSASGSSMFNAQLVDVSQTPLPLPLPTEETQ